METVNFVFRTELGWVGITGTEKGLRRLILPVKSYNEACRELGTLIKENCPVPAVLTDIVGRLERYFNGNKVEFPDKVDFSGATIFQRKVWESARRIPYGETRSYSWVAEEAGYVKAYRAAGNALGKNPLPVIIPCHRVVGKDGKPGGFSRGIEMKRILLNLEASNRDNC